jgi:hypothetical protein
VWAKLRSLLCGLGVILFCQPSFAGARHFGYLYEAPTTPPGIFELENYATTRFGQRGFDEANFRHELEFGITDRLQAGIYFGNWSYVRKGDKRGARYDSASLETIYNFSNPAGDPIGISVYQEVSAGRRVIESETKLIAQKNFGSLILAYNFTLEAKWDGDGLREYGGELQQAIGASYELAPRLSAGAEMLYEIVLPDWQCAKSDNNFFVGPNFSYRGNRWFATVTGLAQVTDTAGEPNYQVRLIFGVAL